MSEDREKYGRHLRETVEQLRQGPWTEQRAEALYDQLLRGEVVSQDYVDYLRACAASRASASR